jgi:hypothetical protein
LARRHKIGDPDVFYDRLSLEIAELSEEHEGILIRLHVLGDFPSVEYVAFWKDTLDEFQNVACFGYTHRSIEAWGGDQIGEAIQSVKELHPERFRIRWSSPVARADGSVVIDNVPKTNRGDNNEIVCPSQTEDTACCATCALCWEISAAKECIAFIKHGPISDVVALENIEKENEAEEKSIGSPQPVIAQSSLLTGTSPSADAEAGPDNHASQPALNPQFAVRAVKPVKIHGLLPAVVTSDYPECILVDPTSLSIEGSYQRDLSAKSLKLIRKIVNEWNWAKFKPPICAKGDDGLFVIDGQHTAIAAATHPGVHRIPIMVVARKQESHRASAFVSQNNDRVAMSPLQLFHARVTARDETCVSVFKEVLVAGMDIPKSPPQKGSAKPGQIVSINQILAEYKSLKKESFISLMECLSATKFAPINSTIIRSAGICVRRADKDPFHGVGSWSTIGEMIGQCYNSASFEAESIVASVNLGVGKYHGGASIIEELCQGYLDG